MQLPKGSDYKRCVDGSKEKLLSQAKRVKARGDREEKELNVMT